jgi:transcriptional regulator with XRE-family HTH domain
MSRKTPEPKGEQAWIVRENVIRFRTELGLSQAELATASGLAVQTIQGLEQGARANPSFQTLQSIAEALGRPIDDFTKKDPPPLDPARLRVITIQVLPGFTVDADILATLDAEVLKANRLQQERWRQRKKR